MRGLCTQGPAKVRPGCRIASVLRRTAIRCCLAAMSLASVSARAAAGTAAVLGASTATVGSVASASSVPSASVTHSNGHLPCTPWFLLDPQPRSPHQPPVRHSIPLALPPSLCDLPSCSPASVHHSTPLTLPPSLCDLPPGSDLQRLPGTASRAALSRGRCRAPHCAQQDVEALPRTRLWPHGGAHRRLQPHAMHLRLLLLLRLRGTVSGHTAHSRQRAWHSKLQL